MDDSTLNFFLKRIRSDDTLQRRKRYSWQSQGPGETLTIAMVLASKLSSDEGDNTSPVADAYHSENSSLVADEHQLRGINGQKAERSH